MACLDKKNCRWSDVRGWFDPQRLTRITTQIGEALVFKLSIDNGRIPDGDEVAAIVDEALLPALGL